MNILQVVPDLHAGGVERTTLEIAEALIANGHKAHVASAGGRMEEAFTTMGGVLHKFDVGSKNPLHYIGNRAKLIDIIKHHNIDIVHARSRMPAWPAYAAAKATGTHFVTTYHGIYNAKSALKRGYNAIMTKGEIIIANSAFTKDHIINEHGTDPSRIQVIARGVDMSRFDPLHITRDAITAQRQAWGVKDEQKLILLPGRLTRWKGQLVAIEALSHLPDNIALVCLGDAQGRDEYVSEMDKLAASLNLSERVKRPGHSTDMPTALMAADVVISASTDPEAFGRIAAEAQAMGIAVVATDHGGAKETVLDAQTGFRVPPSDARALSEGIAKALDWPDYDPQAARTHIEDNFSKARMQGDTLGVYDALLGRF